MALVLPGTWIWISVALYERELSTFFLDETDG